MTATPKTNYNIALVIQRFLPKVLASRSLSGHQKSILNLMQICKTAALGGHKERCDHCHHSKIHYNSCGNRNCPSCQGVNKEKWIIDRQQDLLPVKYFHCVFTIPSELQPYFRYNKKLLFGLIMKCTIDTLKVFGNDPKHGINAKIGSIALLHTWTQQLAFHPHVHCIVPAGGLTNSGSWNHSKSGGNFLFPVHAMSIVFRGKLLAAIHKLFKANKLKLSPQLSADYLYLKNKLYKKDWVVYLSLIHI